MQVADVEDKINCESTEDISIRKNTSPNRNSDIKNKKELGLVLHPSILLV